MLGFDYKSIFNNCNKSGNNNTYTFDQKIVNELIKSKDEQIEQLKERIEGLLKLWTLLYFRTIEAINKNSSFDIIDNFIIRKYLFDDLNL